MKGATTADPDARFWAQVTQRGDCWEWTGTKNRDGYGQYQLSRPRKKVRAHRYAFEALVAPIPAGLCIDHLCRNRGCVNPFHMDVVTHEVNARRQVRQQVAECKHGHPYTPENTIREGNRRRCRECRSALEKRRWQATRTTNNNL